MRNLRFPNVGIVETPEGEVLVKNVLPGQTVECRVRKKRHGQAQGDLLAVTERSSAEGESPCPHFGQVGGCGGCSYQTLPYGEQISLKEKQVRDILKEVYIDTQKPEDNTEAFDRLFEGIKPSPRQFAFRNKMEFSFGDIEKDGPMALGMHKRGSFYDIVTVDSCRIVDEDFRLILKTVLDFAVREELSFFHRMRQAGYLRHLLIRKATHTGEILIALVTTSEDPGKENIPAKFVNELCKLYEDPDRYEGLLREEGIVEGKIAGILHIVNDSVADVVKADRSELLYGKDYFYETLLGLRFKISPFSFFQTNSTGAEVLYETARGYCGDSLGSGKKPVIFDLYSGTGTIAQMMAPVAEKVIGVEIVEEAVEAAKENAELNGLHNCEFIAGDVLKVIDSIQDKPDLIILDPPRDGIHPKALPKILSYGVDTIVYISCKPTSLARDLVIIQKAGYELKLACAVDMFPGTVHVETVVLLSQLRQKPDDYIDVDIDVAELEGTSAETKATYEKIKKYVAEHNDGMKVSSLYIAQVKRKFGIELAENYNLPKSEDTKQPQCPKEKEDAIMEALKVFQMI